MADIKQLPKRRNSKGTPPIEASNLLGDGIEETTPMSFRIPPNFKKRYKLAALEQGKSMKEILMQSFELYMSESRK